jgi:hypothetical protein
MLRISGKSLGVTSEQVNGPSGQFTSTKIHVMVQTPQGPQIEAISVGRDYPPADLPREGEDVELAVAVRAFPLRAGGAAYSFTATSRVKASGQRVAAVS